MGFKYSQHNGYDKYRSTNNDGNTTHSGKATYCEDSSLERLDIISPSASNDSKHHHEWLYKDSNGDYKYGHGEHDNH